MQHGHQSYQWKTHSSMFVVCGFSYMFLLANCNCDCSETTKWHEVVTFGMLFLDACRAMLGARVQLKGWQQAAVAFGSAFGALLDPRRADLIAALGETTGKPAFELVLQRMKNSAEGKVSPY